MFQNDNDTDNDNYNDNDSICDFNYELISNCSFISLKVVRAMFLFLGRDICGWKITVKW